MKQMFHLMNDVGTELEKQLSSLEINKKTKSICTDVKDYVTRYTTDVIASCAFGLSANSIKNPNCDFRESGLRLVRFSYRRAIEFTCIFFLPELVPIFKFKVKKKGS